jgi:hypothetical protein
VKGYDPHTLRDSETLQILLTGVAQKKPTDTVLPRTIGAGEDGRDDVDTWVTTPDMVRELRLAPGSDAIGLVCR